MTSVTHTDVLIIGAGPAGLMAANALENQGVDWICLEKRSEPSTLSKALGIQARTLEMFELLNVHRPFLERGYPGPGTKLHLGDTTPSTEELYHIQSRYPYILIIPQSETEEILEEQLNQSGKFINREHEVIEVSQNSESVYVKADHNGEIHEYRAKYLLACDGSHSKVREALNVEFEGKDDGFTFFLGDVDVPEFNDIYINVFLNDRGAAAFFPYKDGSYRVVGLDRSKQGQPRQDELALEDLQESLDTILPEPLQVENPKWLTYFGTAHRQVDTYRKDRTFFVGDAAHIHNPIGGQGMNLGLQDAVNLAWKIDAVLKGHATDSFLNSYHHERYPIGKNVLRETSAMLRIVLLDGTVGKIRNWAGKWALTQNWVQQRVANHMSHVYNDYDKTEQNRSLRDPSLPKKALQAGDRVPDYLLFFDGTTDERLYPFIRRHGHLCLIYIDDAQDEAVIDYAYDFARKVKEKYSDLITVYLVARGGTVSSDPDHELPIIYDVHHDLQRHVGMRNGHTLLIRPDGHVAFHETTSNSENTLAKIKRFFS